MSLYNKPTYIPNEFLKATKQGWVDTRTNEVIVAIAHLDELVKTDIVKEEVIQVEPIIVDEVEPVLTEPTLENEETSTKPKRKSK